jgi:hypothetical protein
MSKFLEGVQKDVRKIQKDDNSELHKLVVANRDLLAACRQALAYFTDSSHGREWTERGGSEADLLRAAIKKAEATQ